MSDEIDARITEIRTVLLVLALLERGHIEAAKAALIARLPVTDQAYFTKAGTP